MKPGLKISITMALLAAGLWLGRSIGAGGEMVGEVEAGARQRAERPSRPTATTGPAAHDAKELRRRLAREGFDPGGHSKELAALGTAVLQEVILKAAGSPEMATAEEEHERYGLLTAALAELYHRMGAGALEWAAALEEGEVRCQVLGMALEAVAAEDPVSAVPWVQRFRNDYPGEMTHRFMITALASAKARGAEDVLRVFQSLGEGKDGRSVRLGLGGYAEDFDFGALYRGLPKDIEVEGMVNFWAGRDPEGAWQTVAANPATEGRWAGAMTGVLEGVFANMGEIAGVDWTLARLGQVPPGERGQMVRSLYGAIREDRALITTAGKLTEYDRRVFVGEIYNQESRNDETKIAALATLPRADLLEVLTMKDRMTQGYLPGERNPGMGTRRVLEDERDRYQTSLAEMARRFSLTPEEMARIQEKQK